MNSSTPRQRWTTEAENGSVSERHTTGRDTSTRAKEKVNETNNAPRRETTPLSTTELLELSFEQELGESKPDRLHGESGPQKRIQQHTAEQIVGPMVDFLALQMAELLVGSWKPHGATMPQMVEQLATEDEVEIHSQRATLHRAHDSSKRRKRTVDVCEMKTAKIVGNFFVVHAAKYCGLKQHNAIE